MYNELPIISFFFNLLIAMSFISPRYRCVDTVKLTKKNYWRECNTYCKLYRLVCNYWVFNCALVRATLDIRLITNLIQYNDGVYQVLELAMNFTIFDSLKNYFLVCLVMLPLRPNLFQKHKLKIAPRLISTLSAWSTFRGLKLTIFGGYLLLLVEQRGHYRSNQ